MTAQVGVAGHIIKRPRLTRILDETDARIILLCAPAGYGKTTLAREWVATRDEPVLWYSGGPAMADVAALAVDLAELFGGVDSELVERVRFLASRGEEPRVLAKVLARDAPGTETLLVVDDYHFAIGSVEADELFAALSAFIELRVLLTSRVRPQWINPRRRIYGEVAVIDQQLLAFTNQEAEAVLPGQASVHGQAHGWPAVIGLAALQGVRRTAAGAVDPEQLFEFVASDLFTTANNKLQEVLLLLAAGADATRDTARDVLGPTYDVQIAAASDCGFVVRDEHGWISIHPLLRDFLLRQLADGDAASRELILLKVLDSLMAHARWDECYRLLLRFPHENRAAVVLERALPDLLNAGRTRTLNEWVQLAMIRSFGSAIFLLARAEVALRNGNNVEAIAIGRQAAHGLTGDSAARAYLVAARAAHQLDDIEATYENTERAGALAVSPELQTEAYWLALMNAHERDPARVGEHLNRFRRVNDPRPEHAVRLACAEAFLFVGSHGLARAALESAERAYRLSSTVTDPLLRTNALNLRGHMLRLAAEYNSALESADELIEEATRAGLEFVIDHALLIKAGAFIGIRSLLRARQTLQDIEKRAAATSEHVRRNLEMQQAKVRIAAGDLDGAALALAKPAPQMPFALNGEYVSLRGLIAAATGDTATAERSFQAAETAPAYEEVGAFLTLGRAIARAQKANDAASAARAVLACIRGGTLDAVVTACRAAPRLAALAVEGGAATELEALFSRSRDTDLGRRAGLAMRREFRRGETLSPREYEVYELLRQGRTNAEIAKTLYISESTAKVHVRHIFDKLGVHSRAEAAAADVPDG